MSAEGWRIRHERVYARNSRQAFSLLIAEATLVQAPQDGLLETTAFQEKSSLLPAPGVGEKQWEKCFQRHLGSPPGSL